MARTRHGKQQGEAGARRSLGMRITERFLLPFTGPAEVGDLRRGTPTTEEQRERGAQLQRQLRVAPGRDGRAYFVEEDPAQEGGRPAASAPQDADAPAQQTPKPGA